MAAVPMPCCPVSAQSGSAGGGGPQAPPPQVGTRSLNEATPGCLSAIPRNLGTSRTAKSACLGSQQLLEQHQAQHAGPASRSGPSRTPRAPGLSEERVSGKNRESSGKVSRLAEPRRLQGKLAPKRLRDSPAFPRGPWLGFAWRSLCKARQAAGPRAAPCQAALQGVS